MKNLQSYESYNPDFPHRFQTKGYTCGPTAMKILLDFINYPEVSVDYLEKVSGTDGVLGCTDVGMSKMLDHLGIKYNRIVDGNTQDSFNKLDDHLKKDKVILRTLTKGVKHWIVVYDKIGNIYKCSDPWLGLISYNEDQINSIWSPRKYDAFLVATDVERPKIEKIEKKDISEIIQINKDIFEPIIGNVSWLEPYLMTATDFNISVKLTLNGQIIGCYMLALKNPGGSYLKQFPELASLKGLEGVCLGILPLYKSLGYGKMLLAYAENLNYDYMWGEHLKSLNNIDHWTKRRDKVVDFGGIFISVKRK